MKLNARKKMQALSQHPVISKPLIAYSKKEYNTLLFVFRETLAGFSRHNIMGLSASLSFYALFALIPLILLLFYLLSHLVFSSDSAIVKLAIVTGNILPDFSATIMSEVYKASKAKTAWGVLGILLLFWAITPMARAMRTSFYTISSTRPAAAFFKDKFKDILSSLGILVLFFAFTAAGFLVESILRLLGAHLPEQLLGYIGGATTVAITTLLIALFYKLFLPMRVKTQHILFGALLTAILWLLMRPAFALFLSMNPHFGAVFGSMKNMFVSITWLYVNFAVFLLGSVLVITLRKQDALLLRGLFDNVPDKTNYINALMQRYGVTLSTGEVVFAQGNTEKNLYYLAKGEIHLTRDARHLRTIRSGEYFGETASLTEQASRYSAIIASDSADIIVIHADNIHAMLADEPMVARHLLKQLAARLDTID